MTNVIENSIVLIILQVHLAPKWFDTDDSSLAKTAVVNIVFVAFENPLSVVYGNISYCCRQEKQIYKAKYRQACACCCWKHKCKVLTQHEANLLYVPEDTDVPLWVSDYFIMITTCFLFAPIIPNAIPLAIFGSVLNYLAYKYFLLRRFSMPP